MHACERATSVVFPPRPSVRERKAARATGPSSRTQPVQVRPRMPCCSQGVMSFLHAALRRRRFVVQIHVRAPISKLPCLRGMEGTPFVQGRDVTVSISACDADCAGATPVALTISNRMGRSRGLSQVVGSTPTAGYQSQPSSTVEQPPRGVIPRHPLPIPDLISEQRGSFHPNHQDRRPYGKPHP